MYLRTLSFFIEYHINLQLHHFSEISNSYFFPILQLCIFYCCELAYKQPLNSCVPSSTVTYTSYTTVEPKPEKRPDMHLQIEIVRVMRAVLHHRLLLSLLENSFALKLTHVKAALSPAQYLTSFLCSTQNKSDLGFL